MLDFIPAEQLIRIAIYITILGIIWLLMRTAFRVTMKVFQFGCLSILVLGAILIVMNYLQ